MQGGSELWRGLEWRRGFLTAAVTVGCVNALCLLLGLLAKSLQESVDDPIFERIDRAGTTSWTDKVEVITTMGNVPQTQVYTAVFAIGFALWFATQGWRWWIPLFVCPMVWIVERVSQMVLAKVVDRDLDAISLIGTPIGNFPSGGVARLVVVTGAAAYLVVHYARTSRTTTVVLFSIVGVLGFVEAYARLRLNQHWATDVVSGVIFGWLLLAAVIVTLRAFDPDPHGDRPAPRTTDLPERTAAL